MKRVYLSAAIALSLGLVSSVTLAQDASGQSAAATQGQRVNASSTSNTTTANDTKRSAKQLSTVQVTAQSLSLGGGLMSVQTAPKAVSTITREAIEQASPGSNFTQMIGSIPGVNSATDDATGLANGHYSMRGYDSSDIGMTVNGAPITDTGSYSVYGTEYGDSENMGDITVLQGIPDVDMPDSGASGGHIGWATIDPPHEGGVDITETLGTNDYHRTFVRLNTGDLGPVRSWISYSDNSADFWRGNGTLKVSKVDGKSIWTIDDDNSISASLQYSRQSNYQYDTVSKQNVAQYGYDYNYNTSWIPLTGLTGTALKNAVSTDKYYQGLATQPYQSWMYSMDGEFKLADSLHLSVIPYFWYGSGGGGAGQTATESTSLINKYLYANVDLNGDGSVVNGSQGVVYSFSMATTYRPGVVARFNQDFGLDNSLEYGFWYERSRKSQNDTYGLVNPETGAPANMWGTSSWLTYPDGQSQIYYDEYTITELKKGFVTDTWTPNDQWTLQAGLSYLYADRTGSAVDYPGSTTQTPAPGASQSFSNNWHKFLPMAGIKYQLNDQNQFYIGSGETFRVPTNTAAIFGILAAAAPGGAVVDNAAVNKPETSWNTDLGWRFYGDAVSASADIYHSNYFNKQESACFVPAGGSSCSVSYYTAIPHMNMRGFNGEASWKFAEHWKLYGSYTYTQSLIEGAINAGGDNSTDGAPYPTNGKTMPDTPRNMGNLSLGYDDGHLWANLNARATSSLYGDYLNTERVGGFTTYSLGAGYKFDNYGGFKPYIKVNAYNLTNKEAYSYVGSAPLLAASGKALYAAGYYASTPYYGLLQPRTYMITFGASFN
ncbi:TonB-dependent receptor [Rhodanobacter sp. DHB23]|uniref:TonB-dependent receptor n=1 Tax=Rhodanobacter sp. DHB23 TaxID=2775923 RepID=UPI001785F377|nr:TonB-dependent receptor [Rhodanobacter sp. DHB23]MBD8871762.1 TonB-dependent receptor [Rhodanobacter sp. DHB23]